MANVSVCLAHQPLEKLEEVAQRYRGMDLELAVAYISPGGVLNLSQLIKAARCTRITVGIAPINRVVAFRQLQELGAEVFVYLAEPGSIFHPKAYDGINKGLAWAMIGSSNLTSSDLGLNIELNLLIEGQRFTNLFTRLEALLEGYRLQAHPLTGELYRSLEAAEQRLERHTEQRLERHIREREYTDYLRREGIPSAARPALVVPEPLQRQAVEELEHYLQGARLVYAYQMLLCLVMLAHTGNRDFFWQHQAATCFRRFYQLWDQRGLPREKQRGRRRAAIDDPELEESAFIEINVLISFHVLNVEGYWKPVSKETTTLSIQH
jgi:hypothetical protein